MGELAKAVGRLIAIAAPIAIGQGLNLKFPGASGDTFLIVGALLSLLAVVLIYHDKFPRVYLRWPRSSEAPFDKTDDPKMEVHIRVHRAVNETGNAASESWRRWLHLVAENWSAKPAKDARVNIRIRTNGDKGSWREWYWTGARQIVDIVRGTPIAIPVALGDIALPPRNIVGYDKFPHLPIGHWFLTPQGHSDELIHEVKPGRYWVDVEVRWTTGAVTDNFILDLSERGAQRESELVHTVSKDRY